MPSPTDVPYVRGAHQIADLREPERLAANVAVLYREMGADVATDAAAIVGLMAAARRS
jgi:hypothetical protein